MDGRKCALLYNKCFNHQMFWQPFYKIWCTGWFKDWYWVQLSVGGNGEVSKENGNRSPPQYTIMAESQWWSQAWEPFTLKSHENFPSRRERLAPGTEQVFVAYRSTNLRTTRVSPVELSSERKLTTKLPEFVEAGDQSDVVLQQVRDRDTERKQKAQQYADARNHAKDRHIAVGDSVLLDIRKENQTFRYRS